MTFKNNQPVMLYLPPKYVEATRYTSTGTPFECNAFVEGGWVEAIYREKLSTGEHHVYHAGELYIVSADYHLSARATSVPVSRA